MNQSEVAGIVSLIGRVWPEDKSPPDVVSAFKSAVGRAPYDEAHKAVMAEALHSRSGRKTPWGKILGRLAPPPVVGQTGAEYVEQLTAEVWSRRRKNAMGNWWPRVCDATGGDLAVIEEMREIGFRAMEVFGTAEQVCIEMCDAPLAGRHAEPIAAMRRLAERTECAWRSRRVGVPA